jgi:hypothetical protein
MNYTFLFALLGILMMLGAGFIGGFYAYASEHNLLESHPLTTPKRKRVLGKMLQITLIIGALYLIVNSMDILLAGLAYFYSEYGLPRIMGTRYERIFRSYG